MARYILALDQGTTSSRAILFDQNQAAVAVAQREFAQLFPQQGWVEHDPMEIWSSQYSVMMEVIAKSGVDPKDIAAIGITNQRETTILWDRHTGRPIYNAIVWQCRRTAPLVDQLLAQGLEQHIRTTTGLVPDAYFSATKIKWILDQVPGSRQAAQRGDVLFGTVDSWLLWKLTGGAIHATDRTNASRTMLFNIETLDWDDTLLNALDIPRAMLPQVLESSRVFGTTNISGVDIPVAGIAGDQQAALFGQCCFEAGQAKNTYGTGCFLLMNTGSQLCRSQNGLVTTIAASVGSQVQYALEGSVFVGGAVMNCGLSPKAGMQSTMPKRCRTAAACTLCRPSPAWVHPTGICMLGAAWWALPVAPGGSTSSGRPRSPLPTKVPMCWPPWKRTPGCTCGS